ncbi:hypothetical protein [Halosimplex halophilum]|uniref:hypothetical protein n=1 Tax=Halosimplex halophilum TaxID=2559572 RepID=UPI00107F75B1|nr:hypothetical protein [Halosimplex halophilum]
MALDPPARRGLFFFVVGAVLLANVGHLHAISPGSERYEYQRVAVTATDDDLRFSVNDEWANRPESIAGIGCDGLTDTSSRRLCVLETWLLNGSGPPRTLTTDRTDEYWTADQAYTIHGGRFYERTRTTHRTSETVPEGQVRVTLTPRSSMETLDAIAVPIERAPPELRRVIRRDSLTTDHYVHGAEVDTELPSVPANEYDDGGLIIETDDGFAVVTTSYHPGRPALRFVAGVLQWLLGLGLVASGGHRYLTHR